MESVTELVDRARHRDPVAFAELIRRHERAALAVAFGATGDATLAGDAVQEAFLKAWQRLDELKQPERFAAWICMMARNVAIDLFRRSGKTNALPMDHASADLAPHGFAERAETASAVDGALSRLDPLTRQAVVLRYFEGISSKEIAALLDLTPSAVDMRLSRARNELRQLLASADPTAKA